MAQNITLLGASYSAVPSVTLPKTGGGTASFTDVTDTTATASDVASGKYFYTASGVRTQGTASGGGGSSRLVIGDFNTGTNTGRINTLTIPYTGSGYPIAMEVFVKVGPYNSSDTNWYTKIQRYAVGFWSMVKCNMNTTPQYTSQDAQRDGATITAIYKNSTSSATTYTRTSSMNATFYRPSSSQPSASGTGCIIAHSATSIDYYVASSSYGLLANTDYTYIIVYSS